MKIAYIALRGVPISDGIVSLTDELAKRLTEKGHEVTVYTSRHYGNVTGLYNGIYQIRTVPSLKNRNFEKMSITLSASFDQLFRKYDVAHYHAMGPSIFAFMAKMSGKKVIIQSHGIEYERANWGKKARLVLKILEKLSYNMGDELTVVSKALQKHFYDNYKKETVYIPTAVNLPAESSVNMDILKKYNLDIDDYFLFMARIVPEKGAHYLIEAFKRINTNKKLVIAGHIDPDNPYHCKLKEMASSDPRIIFTDNISGETKETILRGAFAFCQPSEIEGLSVALLEAMSYKKCCIVSSIPMNTEAVEQTGIIFESKNVDDLMNKLQYAIDNPSIIKENGEAAYKRVKENYTWEIVANQMEELYLKVLNK